VVTAERGTKTFAKDVLQSLALHRHWERAAVHPTRRAIEEA
jgi:hypothetical protein